MEDVNAQVAVGAVGFLSFVGMNIARCPCACFPSSPAAGRFALAAPEHDPAGAAHPRQRALGMPPRAAWALARKAAGARRMKSPTGWQAVRIPCRAPCTAAGCADGMPRNAFFQLRSPLCLRRLAKPSRGWRLRMQTCVTGRRCGETRLRSAIRRRRRRTAPQVSARTCASSCGRGRSRRAGHLQVPTRRRRRHLPSRLLATRALHLTTTHQLLVIRTACRHEQARLAHAFADCVWPACRYARQHHQPQVRRPLSSTGLHAEHAPWYAFPARGRGRALVLLHARATACAHVRTTHPRPQQLPHQQGPSLTRAACADKAALDKKTSQARPSSRYAAKRERSTNPFSRAYHTYVL